MAFETGQATIAETEKLTEARAAIEEALASSSAPCLTCSFQTEDMAVLALIREKAPDIPVLFLETGYHFAETYQYRDEMTARYGLNLVNVIPKQTVAEQESAIRHTESHGARSLLQAPQSGAAVQFT